MEMANACGMIYSVTYHYNEDLLDYNSYILKLSFTEYFKGELYTKAISKLANEMYILKFSAFLNLANIISHTKFEKDKTIGSGRKNKQCSIGIKINPMLHCLFLRPDLMVLYF
jgi:hypothetical protein